MLPNSSLEAIQFMRQDFYYLRRQGRARAAGRDIGYSVRLTSRHNTAAAARVTQDPAAGGYGVQRDKGRRQVFDESSFG